MALSLDLQQIDAAAPLYQAWDAIEGWFTHEQAVALQKIVAGLPRSSRILEVGTWQGRSAVAIASAMPAGSRLYCVDTLLGSAEHEGVSRSQMGACLLDNIARFGLERDIRILVVPSREAMTFFGDQCLDLVFVDGSHDWLSVNSDLLWVRKVKDGGWLVMHDYDSPLWPAVAKVVDASGLRGEVIAPYLWAAQIGEHR